MARWDHADLLSMDAKVVLYPEYCSDADLVYWLGYYKNDPSSQKPILEELKRRKPKNVDGTR